MAQRADSLLSRQNRPEMMALLRAMSVCHTRAQRLDNLRLAVSVLVGVAGAAVAVAGVSPTGAAAATVTSVGALWGVANAVGLGMWSRGQIHRAALLQEMFDVDLFGLPWNTVAAGERVSAQEVSRLERAYRGDERYLRDYYEVPALPRPYDVLACQQQNLGWGSRLRLRYAYTVLAAVAAWAAAGVAIGVAVGSTVSQLLLQWFVPSLGALLLGVEIYRGQRDIALDRNRAMSVLDGRVAAVGPTDGEPGREALLTLARQIQDLIFHSRRGQGRVPDWFFRRFHLADRADFQAAMNRFVDVLDARVRAPRVD